MKILYIGDMNSIHCNKLAVFYVEKGYEIHALTEYEPRIKIPGVKYHYLTPVKAKLCFKYLINRLFYHIIARFPWKIYNFLQIGFLRVRGFYRMIDEIKPDLIHAHFATDNGRYTYYSGFRPYIVSCWGSDILVLPKKSVFFKEEVRKVLQAASLIHTSGYPLTDVIMDDYGISRDKILELQYGINRSILAKLPDLKKSFLHNPVRIISTRAAKAVYDNETLIEAARILSEQGFCVEIKMVTQGPLLGKYKKMISTYNLSNIDIIPWMDQDLLYNHLQNSDIYVSCAVSDSLSLSLLEAMTACVYPIIADVPAMCKVIRHGENGMLFKKSNAADLAKAIINAVQDREKLKAAVIYNRKWIEEKHVLEENLMQIEQIYKRIGRKQ